ncbi:NAD(P)H-quinone oxidoreductase, partial [bacterium]|nr:NAD(P)H-quinone oxidoreductase [bacterium]
DGLSQDWLQGTLAGKPAGVFTSASSLHGGHESTLLTMMIPLLHLGALITGIPYHENPELMETSAGGTPYGPSYWVRSNLEMTQEEKKLCYALGYRVAMIAKRLKNL